MTLPNLKVIVTNRSFERTVVVISNNGGALGRYRQRTIVDEAAQRKLLSHSLAVYLAP
jgi:hypothetical protein